MNRTKLTTFNISWICDDGSAGSTQLVTKNAADAVEFIKERVIRGHKANQTWDRPVLVAFIFDTEQQFLRRFEVTYGAPAYRASTAFGAATFKINEV